MRMRTRLLGAIVLTALPGLAGGDMARAQTQRGPSLEEQLLEDLRADPLDDAVHDELFAPGKEPPDGKAGKPRRPDGPGDLDAELLDELGRASLRGDENALVDLARQMRSVEGRIGRSDSGEQTRGMQKEIVAQLEELLKQARKQCSGQAKPSQQPQQVASRKPASQPKAGQKPGQGSPKPSSAPSDPQTKPGTAAARQVDLEAMYGLMKEVWGELPAGERQQMLELPDEEFLPKYELLIEAYFKRLVEEQEEADRWPNH
jgi:TolA-binding protein